MIIFEVMTYIHTYSISTYKLGPSGRMGRVKNHSQSSKTGREWKKTFPKFGNGKGMKKSIPKVRERESQTSILGNDREREFPLTPGALQCCCCFNFLYLNSMLDYSCFLMLSKGDGIIQCTVLKPIHVSED